MWNAIIASLKRHRPKLHSDIDALPRDGVRASSRTKARPPWMTPRRLCCLNCRPNRKCFFALSVGHCWASGQSIRCFHPHRANARQGALLSIDICNGSPFADGGNIFPLFSRLFNGNVMGARF
jgi:hypothetical protein